MIREKWFLNLLIYLQDIRRISAQQKYLAEQGLIIDKSYNAIMALVVSWTRCQCEWLSNK